MSPFATPLPRVPNPWHAVIATVLRDIRVGELTVVMPDGREHLFTGRAAGPSASISVHDGSIARRILAGGDIAFAEGYLDGLWDTPDLDAVLDLGLANMSQGWIADVPWAMRPLHRLWHSMQNNNERGGAKRNIAYHYDLGNDFYELWLDETMTYSAACFTGDDDAATGAALECAQRRKWDHILELIQPSRGDHLLEIGCGWGGFAMHAAREAGCKVTGITLSEAQARLARERVAKLGLQGTVDIRLQDYRQTAGTFDGVVSIEMFEAVGQKWWPVFFNTVRTLLKPGAAAGLQVITIAEKDFDEYRRHPDFIQRYIFPGGMLPSPGRFNEAAEQQGLIVSDPRFFGTDYGKTLAAWRERFEGALPAIREMGFDERFIRMWRYYLAYCRTGFERGSIDVMQARLES